MITRDANRFWLERVDFVMQWKNWGVKGGVALAVMAAMVGCMPVQPTTSPADATPADVAPMQVTPAVTAEATVAPSEEMTDTMTGEATEDAPGMPTEVAISTDDPFAYCAAVGTIDVPDARFTGPDVPDVIAEGIRDVFGVVGVDLEVYRRGTFWRCMDGAVYACNVGANQPCESQADTSQEPTQPMIDFCAEAVNANADYIPAVVTGRTTIYEWGCKDSAPVIIDQATEVDSQGYLEFIWHKLTPPQ